MPRKYHKKTTAFLQCPRLHKLPHKSSTGDCTPLYCADKENLLNPTVKEDRLLQNQRPVEEEAATLTEATTPSEVAAEVEESYPDNEKAKRAVRVDTLTQLSHAAARSAARATFFKVPQNLEPAEIEAWAQTKAVSMLPKALAELDYQLTMGDDNQRRDAMRDVLDINGMRKREANGSTGATIILNLNGKELPWAQKVVEKLSVDKNKIEDATTE